MINLLLSATPSGEGLFATEPAPATMQVPSAAPPAAAPFGDLLIEIALQYDLDGEAMQPEHATAHVHPTAADEHTPTPLDVEPTAEALAQTAVAPPTTTMTTMAAPSTPSPDAPRVSAVAGEPFVERASGTPAVSADPRVVLVQARADAAAIDTSAAGAVATLGTQLPHSPAPQPAVSLAPTSGAEPVSASERIVTSMFASMHAPMAQPVGVVASERTPPSEGPVVSARPNLATALGERLHVQIARGVEHAVVRLDPPSLGSVEIVIRQEGGQLQVHLRASHAEVVRQLQAIGETLRQDLVQRQHGDVSVQVWEREGEGRQHSRQPERDVPGRALSEAGDETESTFALASE